MSPEALALRMPLRLRVAAALGAIYLFWGSTYLAIRIAIATIPPFLLTGLQFLAAGSILYALALARGAARPLRPQWTAAFILGFLLVLGGNGGVVWAEQSVPSGLAALLISMEPLWIVLLDWAQRGRPRPHGGVLIGLVLGFAGIILLIAPGRVSHQMEVNPWGAAALAAASVCWALGSIYSRGVRLPESPLLATALEMLAGGALAILVSLALGEPFHMGQVSLASWMALFYLIVFGSLLGFTLYLWLLRVTSAAQAATYAYVNPLVALLLGWIFAGEPLTPRMLAAAAVIVAAVLTIEIYSGREALEALEI